MAPKKSNAAHIESLGDSMTPEETQLMSDNEAAERAQPELELETAPAPETQEQPLAAAPKTEAQPDIDPETGKQRKVDYGAFHSERERRKAAEAEGQKLREEVAKFNGRLETLQQLAQQTKAKPETEQPVVIPDVNTDPVGHFKAQLEISNSKIEGFSKWQQSQESDRQALNNVQELSRIALQSETEFSKTTPDYGEAANYLKASRSAELKAMGYAQGAIDQFILQDAVTIAAQALGAKLSPASVIYETAKARGYQVKAVAAAAARPAPAAVQSSDAQKIATVAKGQAATQSLGQVNGESVPDLSPESILKMSDAEFAKWANDDNWRKLMGG